MPDLDAIHLIAVDLDGTLLDSTGALSPENTAAVKEALARGLRVIPVSARPPFGIAEFAGRLGLSGPLIAYNGALIIENDEIIRSIPMSPDDTEAVLKIIRRHDLYTGYYAGMEWFVEKVRDEAAWEGRALSREPRVANLSADSPPLPHKMIVADLKDRSRLEQGYLEMRRTLPHLNIHYSGPASFEVSDQAASKGIALAFLAAYMKLQPGAIMCIGDNENDLDMLDFAGLPVAVSNAQASVKAAADWLVGSNDDHGVAEAIHRLLAARELRKEL